MQHYNGTKLLSLKDINGDLPEIYIVCGNRTGGKTTFFNRMLMNHALSKKTKFMLIYRYQGELTEIAPKFFKDIGSLFFPTWAMIEEKMSKGLYINLFIKEKINEKAPPIHVGYAVALNDADKFKKFSHLFSDVSEMLFDDFQTETNKYLSHEVDKLLSLHTTVARGQGKMVRRVPLYMTSNATSLINPYFVAMGLSDKIKADTKFIKSEGCVLEINRNSEAANAQELSAFNRAFKQSNYLSMARENVYLNDNIMFIEELKGKNHYITTITCDGENYAIRDYPDLGLIYCSTNIDETCPRRIAITNEDHSINHLMLTRHEIGVARMRLYYQKGIFRFQNLMCKNAILKMISIY